MVNKQAPGNRGHNNESNMAKRHYRGMHWTNNSATGEQKAKKGFSTLDEALLFMRRNKFDGDVQPYVCDVCGMWHIGHYRNK